MKHFIFLFLLATIASSCNSQPNFDAFVKKFKPLNLPLKDILSLQKTDTLDGKKANDILIRGKKERPKYIDKNGNIQTINKYYGLYPEKPFEYLKDVKNLKGEWEEKKLYFNTKVIPIGGITLNPKYTTLLIKVIDYETTFYDLWNFSKGGEVLSVVCLFWGMRDAGPQNEQVTFTIVNSEITGDGIILWRENNDGLETLRTYKLNNDGYFQIVEEEQKGKSEY
jgi:hypothetical protein